MQENWQERTRNIIKPQVILHGRMRDLNRLHWCILLFEMFDTQAGAIGSVAGCAKPTGPAPGYRKTALVAKERIVRLGGVTKKYRQR